MTNELIHEKSPYLLQHAHNPVQWYPWASKAFEKAKKEAKPIFLSIGYSTCHWCHVMENESFENQDVAKLLNENFISIKVDREERPDIDALYMQAVMTMTGSGGWPMSVFLTPELEPFYGGTYFPPEDRWGRPGFKTLLTAISEKWAKEKDQVLEAGTAFAGALKREIEKPVDGGTALGEETLYKAYEQFRSRFDARSGGFGGAPKFPSGHNLSFLLSHWKRTQNPEALAIVEKTLTAMASGGIYDFLGGGFHRYSTDAEWRVPHFEKMLYDQALLAKTYLEAYQATQNPLYASVASGVLDYVLRDLTGKERVFFSAEDADSLDEVAGKKLEGAFYLWTQHEINEALGVEEAKLISECFGTHPEGNIAQDPHGEFKGKNVLHWVAQRPKTDDERLETARNILFEARKTRPHLDDKVLVDWNSLMISAFSLGGAVLGDKRYEKAARDAADFILEKMVQNGRLFHRYRQGETAVPGFLDDYAFFIHALVSLYETTFELRYLEKAVYFAEQMITLFWDDAAGGFYLIARDSQEPLFSRIKTYYDGAIPSGNSAACLALLRLSKLTMNEDFEKFARLLLNAVSGSVSNYPSGYSQLLSALDFVVGTSIEIVLAGASVEQTGKLKREIFSHFVPNKVVAYYPDDLAQVEKAKKLMPFLVNQSTIDGKPTAYICKDYSCQKPTTELAWVRQLLK